MGGRLRPVRAGGPHSVAIPLTIAAASLTTQQLTKQLVAVLCCSVACTLWLATPAHDVLGEAQA